MTFSSLAFIYAFLPMSIALYYIAPFRFKNTVLLVVSLLFYSFSEPINMVLMLTSVCFDYAMSYSMRYADQNMKLRAVALAASVIKNIALVIYVSMQVASGKMEMPIGMNVYTFTALGYMVDVYKGEVPYEENIIDFALFCTFFGKIFAGPMVSYEKMRLQLKNKHLSLKLISSGIVTFTYGLAKCVIISKTMYSIYYNARGYYFSGHVSVVTVWIIVLSMALSLYYELSSFCDMARGLANMFSFTLPQNFYYPYQALSVADFFSRFNITVYKFITKYVYEPLGENKNGVYSTVVNTLLCSMLMGMWFGIYTNYAMWGVYLGVFVIAEEYFLERYLEKLPNIVCRIYTFVVVLSSFTVFVSKTPKQMVEFLSVMLGLADIPLFEEHIVYLLFTNYFLIAVSLIFITSLPHNGTRWLEKRFPRFMAAVQGVTNIILLIIATSFLMV